LARRLRFTLRLRLRVACARFVFERFETLRFERFPFGVGMSSSPAADCVKGRL
jgi:hypothetical protein